MKDLVMPSIVQVFNDQVGLRPRRDDKYTEGTVATLTEGTDLTSAQSINRTPFGTLTPKEIGNFTVITLDRIASDPISDIVADLAEWATFQVREQVEKDLLAAFPNFTGGTVGNAGSALTWDTIINGQALLRAAGVPGPYNVVLHEYAYTKLATARANALPIVFQQKLLDANRYYLGSFGDMDFYTTGVLAAGTAVKQGIFSKKAVAYDNRRPIMIEGQYFVTLRGTKYVLTHEYAAGAWRTDHGVQIVSDASVPS